MLITDVAKKVKESSLVLSQASQEKREMALVAIKKSLELNKAIILKENNRDILMAKEKKLSSAMIDRLALNEESLLSICHGIEELKEQEDWVFKTSKSYKRNDLFIKKQHVPLGVIGMIFESRPNVCIDACTLGLKSANGMILKGGKEAQFSNQILLKIIKEAIKDYVPESSFELISSREDVQKMLKLKEFIDVIIPRGGESLINYVYTHSEIPVIAHFKGLCHQYVNKSADPEVTLRVCLNSKVQRTGVCNATECFLVDEEVGEDLIRKLLEELSKEGVEVFGCEKSMMLNSKVKKAFSENYSTEYLDKKVSFKVVKNIDEAIRHIQKYGSRHTEGILAQEKSEIDKFSKAVDASCIMVNTSTRFNDGGELGLGAEIGIATSKLHNYGPMGVKSLSIERFIVESNGKLR